MFPYIILQPLYFQAIPHMGHQIYQSVVYSYCKEMIMTTTVYLQFLIHTYIFFVHTNTATNYIFSFSLQRQKRLKLQRQKWRTLKNIQHRRTFKDSYIASSQDIKHAFPFQVKSFKRMNSLPTTNFNDDFLEIVI